MAWEIISRASVANLTGVSESILQDDWYNYAVALIAERTGINNIANPSPVTEQHIVYSSGVIPVHHPPILNVVGVAVNSVSMPPLEFTWTERSILLNNSSIPRNKRNVVEIQYVSGTNTVDYAVAICIAFVIKEFAAIRTMEGAQSLVQFYRPGQSRATEKPLVEWGIHGKIMGIIESFLGKRFNAR